jgi:hypothetical protein
LRDSSDSHMLMPNVRAGKSGRVVEGKTMGEAFDFALLLVGVPIIIISVIFVIGRLLLSLLSEAPKDSGGWGADDD